MEGAVHHVFARGNNRQLIFLDDLDRRRYLDGLARVIGLAGWRCLTYCLMPNHVHLLIETPRPTLGWGMQRLHGDYARAFNVRHRRVGHVFQGRYGANRVEDDAQLWMTVAYIARNPVEAGLVRQAAAWPWSGHAAMGSGRSPCLDEGRLLAYFKAFGGDRVRRYRECV
jgi:REP element-mobilizing transposase RayT